LVKLFAQCRHTCIISRLADNAAGLSPTTSCGAGGGRRGAGLGWTEPYSLIHLPACHQTKLQHQQPVRMKMHNQSPATTETRKSGEFKAEDCMPLISEGIGIY